VVASALGGIPLVIEDRQTGRLISPGDVQALSKALIEITGNQNERIRLGFAARRAVESRYNWEIVARQMVGMLERASWYTAQKTRMGSIYRDQMIRLLGRRSNQGRVLDVGCHDGLFLSTLSAPFRVGVDPEPKPGSPGVLFVRADGRFLPFIPGGFDSVYALDVIEHVADDQAFARTLLEALAPGGKLFLSTPSQEIRMFPRFLTGWISRSWGHDLRWGYTVERLQELFDFPGFEINVQPWNAPAYRFAYLPGRLGYALAPRLMRNLIRKIAGWDARRTEGQHGFWLLEASRREVDCLSDVPGVDE
jgi:SAM-dependent methyltransferase